MLAYLGLGTEQTVKPTSKSEQRVGVEAFYGINTAYQLTAVVKCLAGAAVECDRRLI